MVASYLLPHRVAIKFTETMKVKELYKLYKDSQVNFVLLYTTPKL